MECSEARRLIDAGMRPGPSDPKRATLGFHLVNCPGCRAYLSGGPDQGLLADLLTAPPPSAPAALPPALPRPARMRPAAPPSAKPRKATPWWRHAVVALLAVLALSLGMAAGRIARAAYTIRENIVAMQVTSAPRPAATPAIALPTAATTATPPPPPTAEGETVLAAAGPAAAALATATPLGVSSSDALATSEAGLPAAAPRPSATLGPPTAISLPPIGAAPLPTLMPTIGVAPVSGEPIHILLLGSDRRPGESWQTRSDAVMVMRLEPDTQRVALLSFPRDLIVSIPGYGYARINATTVYGDLYPQLGGGSELARQTVSQLLGIPIHHVVRTDFNAFITGIDAIGGIDIMVEKELYDPQYPTMDYRYMVAHFLPGPQHMDGQTALIYSRLRHADSDYHRARRQQQVVQAIIQRVRDQNLLAQAQMLSDLSTALRDNIQTDMSFEQMVGVAWAFRSFTPEQLERYTLDENLTVMGLPGDPYAITASPGAIQHVANQLLGR
jgi:polyisoprenyl-teichoic acid--peptidoglycan teichoic acid transferase